MTVTQSVAQKDSRKRGPNTAWRNAIRAAVNEIDKDTGVKKLRLVARACVREALAGDVNAMKEIGDRLDGKASQHLTADINNTTRIIQPVERTPDEWNEEAGVTVIDGAD